MRATKERRHEHGKADLRARRRALQNGLPAPFAFFGRVLAHRDEDFHDSLLALWSALPSRILPKAETVGDKKKSAMSTSRPKVCRTRLIMRISCNESPPSSRKESSTPT